MEDLNNSHKEEVNDDDDGHLTSLGLSAERLETDLRSAVRYEERHWNENDAKLRAVHQRVATYDQFRGIVDGCELRPLNYKEVEAATKHHAGWSPVLTPTSHAPPSTSSPSGLTNLTSMDPERHKKPTEYSSPDQFIKHWISLTSNAQSSWEASCASLLAAQRPAFIQHLFASSRALSVLPQILECLRYTADGGADAEKARSDVLQMMCIIGDSANFDLTAALFSNEEKATVKTIIDSLESKMGGSDELVALRVQWCVD